MSRTLWESSVRDFIVATRSDQADPDGTILEGVLRAELDLERIQAVRMLAVEVLAGAGLPLWLLLGRPGRWSMDFRNLALLAWATCAAAVAVAIVFEWRCRRRRTALLALLVPPTAQRP